ncbi:biotin-dependent carboxyltransferase family protein [Acidaminobacter sp. JC074]|uniref:5-oxoprolinase subunit C family protein n=1 Tax=Acidaminobacter sp. JC074 TaxID=2530199 RepID=UPI001F0E72AC|nr:biotin-dependent carboxyltransferase family protein [Acidaminobacter sp. JC074]MCH4890560.1 biotin-dependent carboxyltransferase family protein [Acidaminobacter sp. JC074]
MLGFTVKQAGLLSTFQDKGRLGYQSEGMPICGAMDQEAMILANKLVGKDHGPVLEMTFMGSSIEFKKEMAIAITGADMQAQLNNRALNMYQTLYVKSGDILSFKGLMSGFRTYIAFSDILELEEVYASQSTYLKIAAGGYKGRKLEAGDDIHVKACELPKFGKVVKLHRKDQIRVLLGYECDDFKSPQDLFKHTYKVTNDLDRMGIRLEGGALEHKEGADIISSPIIPGAIQVPKSGQPMVMLRDAQTIGGYTRVGTVISCDLDKLAQKKPGDTVCFEAVTLEEAVKIKKEWLKALNEICLADDRRHFSVSVAGTTYDVYVEEI